MDLDLIGLEKDNSPPELPTPETLDHPDPDLLLRLMQGRLSRPEAARVVRHLLKGCPLCAAETRRLWSLGEQPLCRLPDLEGSLSFPAREVGLWT